MTQKQKRTLILASIIGTLFACYDEDEKTNLHNELHSRIGKGIRKQAKLFGEAGVTQVAHKEGNAIWGSAVDHFRDEGISIEASSCVLAIVNLDEKALSKHYGLGAGKLGKWAKPSKRSDAAELEKSGNEVAKFVFDAVNELYSIQEQKKIIVLERIRMSKETA